jgi:hypothetical protein
VSSRRRGAGAFAALALVVVAAGCGSDGAAPAAEPDRALTGPQGAVGQFVVECAYSHSAYDDPIVHPGHEGASHRHDFFGNVATAADSTYDELLETDTTCHQRLDTASYWAPSLLDADGVPVVPVLATAYYRAGEDVDPATVEPYPPGLMMVAGDPLATAAQPTSIVAWSCGAGGLRASAPTTCRGQAGPRLLVTFPDCWDGEHVDSEDHRSHVAYSHDGACDDDHPVPIPQLQFTIDYPPVPGDPAEFALASGATSTAHADFWNVWHQAKLADEVALCLHRQLVCGVSG